MQNVLQENLEHFATKMLSDVEDGNESPLRAYAILKQAESFIKECVEQVKGGAITEADKFGEKTFETNGCQFQIKEGRRNWSFTGCPTWVDRNANLKALESELKHTFEIMQNNPDKVVADQNTGEIELPTLTFSAPSLSVKPLKE